MTYRRGTLIALGCGLTLVLFSAASPAAVTAGYVATGARLQAASGSQEIVYKPMPKTGKKYELGDGNYVVYDFSEKPKMGTVILKIQVFNKKGEQITPSLIKGRSDMPSMRGAHDSGDVEFKLNRRNDYLMPVNIVMPGDWEVRVTFFKDGKPVYYGSITFDV
ncbi:MAG: hypothetical protein Q8O91_09450 [Candidatus Aminicenantes bacterium]|nr:hypothetical protein [Candidatus Aminicenantes bacterium]